LGLLDLLLEKKDLKAYIDFRIAALRDEDRKVILNLSPEKREFAHVRITGRIAEMYQLRKAISQGTLKERSKAYCAIVKNKKDK
jgi:hypothetical protein